MTSGPTRVPDLSPLEGSVTATAKEVEKAEKVQSAKAMESAIAIAGKVVGKSAPMTPDRLSALVALGAAIEGKAREIGRVDFSENLRREVGEAHDAIVLALSGKNPMVCVVALDLIRKQYLDKIYENA